tara:strand:- start:1062 stop:1304 length:243 start_codon:yes stop_codon:yes gene_type:complete
MAVQPDVSIVKTGIVSVSVVLIILILSFGGCTAHSRTLEYAERQEYLKKIESVEIDPCEQCLRRTFDTMKVKLRKLEESK